MGAHLAGGLTPMLVTALLAYLDWRWLFVLFGSIGFVWSAAWYRWFRDSPAEHPEAGAAERELIESGLGADAGPALEPTQWKRLLANRTVVCLCLMYFTQAFGGTFYVTWLPTYLASRGLTGMTAGILAGLPLILSAAADLLGGVATDRAARRLGLRLGRIIIGGGALAAAGLFTIAGTFAASPVAAAVLIALGGASSNFLLGAAWETCLDIGGRRAGAVSAAMNTSGQVGSILSPILVAAVVRRFADWSAPFIWRACCSCWARCAGCGSIRPRRSLSDVSFGCRRQASGHILNEPIHPRTRKWRNGRRTSLRGWRSQDRGGSNPPFRTIRLGLGSHQGLAHGRPSLQCGRVE
jgi:MFS transporter, ACS family, glucarate transporter